MNLKPTIAAVLLLGGITNLRAQPAEKDSSMAECPMMKDAAMEERGDHATGFSHAKTTHHFRLAGDGGAIEVSANDPQDAASIGEIRGHLGHIAKLFAQGNSEIPMLVHDRLPDGAAVMAQQKGNIASLLVGVAAMARSARVNAPLLSPKPEQVSARSPIRT